MVECSFNNCKSKKGATGVKFFYFRKHDWEIWRDACKNPALGKFAQSTLISKKVVCSLHFSPNDYSMILPPFNSKLNKSAIPRTTGKDIS